MLSRDSGLRVQGYVLPDHEAERKVYARGTGLVRESDPGGRLELTRGDQGFHR